MIKNIKIKLCPRGAQTCVLPLFCNRDLEIIPMTLKLEGALNILKMYLHTEHEAAVKTSELLQSVIVADILIKPQQFPTSSF